MCTITFYYVLSQSLSHVQWETLLNQLATCRMGVYIVPRRVLSMGSSPIANRDYF